MVNGVFIKKYNLRGSDFDKFMEIKPSAVLDLFQDVAGLHAEELGIGFNAMLEKGLLWVVMKVKYELVKMPRMYQNVIVKTWPKEPKRLDFERNYLILDENEDVLIKGTSQWAIISSETRKLTRATNVYEKIDEFCDDVVFDGKIIRIPDFEALEPMVSVISGFSELDSNGHVNNIHYADYVINAINPQKPMNIRNFQIDFHKEIMLGDKTDIFVEENEDILVKGMQGDNIMFSARISK